VPYRVRHRSAPEPAFSPRQRGAALQTITGVFGATDARGRAIIATIMNLAT
jgi:hypothetical protein